MTGRPLFVSRYGEFYPNIFRRNASYHFHSLVSSHIISPHQLYSWNNRCKMTILFSQSIQGQSPSIHILHKFTEGMISSQKLSNDCLLCQASHMNLGARKMAEQDYCNREVKKRGAVRQQSGYVSKWSSHWALMMEDTASNLAWAYKYSWVCSLCKCCDYVIALQARLHCLQSCLSQELSSSLVMLKLSFGRAVIHNQNLFVFHNEHIHNRMVLWPV